MTVSGPAATGPMPSWLGRPVADRPTSITVTVQERDAALASDLAWSDAASFTVTPDAPLLGPGAPPPDFVLWSGTVASSVPIDADRYRLLIQEHEIYPADPPAGRLDIVLRPAFGTRLVYAETVPLDAALLRAATYPATAQLPD